MAQLPKYPYRVIVTSHYGENGQRVEQHNYEILPGALAYREIALRKPATRKVELLMVLDESTPSHCEFDMRGNGARAGNRTQVSTQGS